MNHRIFETIFAGYDETATSATDAAIIADKPLYEIVNTYYPNAQDEIAQLEKQAVLEELSAQGITGQQAQIYLELYEQNRQTEFDATQKAFCLYDQEEKANNLESLVANLSKTVYYYSTHGGDIAPANLDNFTADNASVPGGIDDMARFKAKITLPNGETVNCTGKTISDAFNNLLLRYTAGIAIPQTKMQTLREYGDNWYQRYHLPKVKPNHAKNTRGTLNNHIYPLIGDKQLNEITHDDIQGVFNAMNGSAKSTVDKVRIILNQIYKNAVEDGIITVNIMDSKRYVVSKKVTKREALTPAQAQSIISQLEMLDEDEKLFLGLVIMTGMRRGEILALTWDDIDFDNRLVHVKQAVTFVNNRPVIGDPKSKAGIRDIAITTHLFTILSAISNKQGYVVKNRKTKSIPLTETAFRRLWQRIESKINMFGATPHILRHTYATMIEPYTDAKTLQSVMGHSDIQTTLNRYTHPLRRNIQALASVDVFATQNATLPQ